MTTTTLRSDSRSRVSLSRALRAEFVRAKGSAAARLAVAGLLIALLQAAGWLLVPSGPAGDWSALLGWQSLYATGLLAPVVALLAASASAREATAREGGTWARPLTPGVAWTARSLVLAWQSLLLHLALTVPLIGLGLLTGLSDPPVARFVTLWLVLWGTSLLPLMLALVLARRVGMLLTVGFAVIWQVAGTITAESSLWWAQPWSWGVRAVLPVLEIHANAVGLQPDSPIRLWNPWWPTLASIAAAGVVLVVIARVASGGEPRRVGLRAWVARLRVGGDPQGERRTRLDAGHHRGHSTTEDHPPVDQGSSLARHDFSPRGPIERGRPRPARAQLTLLRGTGVFPLVLVTLGVVAVVGAIWDAEYVRGVATWLVVPLGSCVLAALAWSAMAPGWRVAVLRTTPARLAASMLGVCLGLLAVVVTWVALIAALSGGVSIAVPVLLFAVGAMVLVTSLWLATRFGAGVALGVVLVVLVVSLVFGATTIADSTLWIVGVLAWPLTATSAPRIAGVLTVTLVVCVLAGAAWSAALRRAARN